jgi:pSer/pThr/pTyr-binding forkhead associated (FHA) protein
MSEMSYWLVMQANDGRERPFPVRKHTTVIGRETTCDLRVPVSTVSQKHCQISLEEGRLRIVDLKSEAGTFHNGQRVEDATLKHEDTLTIGPVRFVVRELTEESLGDPDQPEIVIERLPEPVDIASSVIPTNQEVG